MENVAIREVINLLKNSIEEDKCEVWDLKSMIKNLEINSTGANGEISLVGVLKQDLNLRCESISKKDGELKLAYKTYGII